VRLSPISACMIGDFFFFPSRVAHNTRLTTAHLPSLGLRTVSRSQNALRWSTARVSRVRGSRGGESVQL
jgi:hypothetical protein